MVRWCGEYGQRVGQATVYSISSRDKPLAASSRSYSSICEFRKRQISSQCTGIISTVVVLSAAARSRAMAWWERLSGAELYAYLYARHNRVRRYEKGKTYQKPMSESAPPDLMRAFKPVAKPSGGLLEEKHPIGRRHQKPSAAQRE